MSSSLTPDRRRRAVSTVTTEPLLWAAVGSVFIFPVPSPVDALGVNSGTLPADLSPVPVSVLVPHGCFLFPSLQNRPSPGAFSQRTPQVSPAPLNPPQPFIRPGASPPTLLPPLPPRSRRRRRLPGHRGAPAAAEVRVRLPSAGRGRGGAACESGDT